MRLSNDLLMGIIIGILLIKSIKNLKFLFMSKNDKRIQSIIKTLVRQSARWSTAAKQDKSVMIKVLHANYGAGYLWALHEWANPEEIKEATGVDYHQMKKEIIKVQDDSTKALMKLCPKFAPDQSYLTEIGKK